MNIKKTELFKIKNGFDSAMPIELKEQLNLNLNATFLHTVFSELCTYCRGKVGNITTDVECRDNSRQICWSSTGCYRLTFTDFTSQLYHIEKVCH